MADKETWDDYSKLVLKELERLNDNYVDMRKDMDARFNELNQKLTEVKNIEAKVQVHDVWIDKVSEIWSPTQMKEAKDELYKQKNRWVAAIAIISFTQIVIALVAALWGKF